jgi:hypothetical protein
MTNNDIDDDSKFPSYDHVDETEYAQSRGFEAYCYEKPCEPDEEAVKCCQWCVDAWKQGWWMAKCDDLGY